MNFYDYIAQGEEVDDQIYAAACDLIKHGLQVIPLVKKEKRPIDAMSNMSKVRQNPINTHNVDFYFKGREVDIALMLRQNMEVIDIDSKNLDGLSEDFMFALQHGDEELYDKLVISRTPTGGLHFLYRAEQVGGPVNMAQIHGKNQPLTIIERISETNKNFIKCAPSEGYEFIQGNPMELPVLTIEERNWLCGLAYSFNKITPPEVKEKEATRDDSPWNVFNDSNDWTYILGELKERGWGEMQDRHDKIVLQRPGQTNQHSAYLFKDSNTLYVFSGSTELKTEVTYTPFSIYAHFYHEGNIGAATAALAAQGIGTNIYEQGEFWIREGKKILIKYTDLSEWLKRMGYRFHNQQLVKISNNIVSIIEEKHLKQAFLNSTEYHMQDYFYDKVAGIFSDKGGLMAMISEIDADKFIRDDINTTWLFFKNYAVKITKDQVSTIQYKDIDGYIWEGSIIERSFYNSDYSGCDAERFVNILGGDNSDKLKMLMGYALSRYKDPINPRAGVLTEDVDSTTIGQSHGGSGKGLLFNFIRKFRKVTDIDGKNFKPGSDFAWQSVDQDTDIIFIDDLDKGFKFTTLFSILTGPIPINKKNMKEIILPFEISPKIFLSSNHSVGDIDISTERRQYNFAVRKYFGTDIQPIDEFGRQFFSEWDTKEWLRFDNFMCECARLYIAQDIKKDINNQTESTKERSLVSNTSADFVDYMDDQLKSNFFDFACSELKVARVVIDGSLTTNAVDVALFLKNEDNPHYYLLRPKDELVDVIRTKTNFKGLSTTLLSQWLQKWGKSRGVEVDISYRKTGVNGRYYRIISFPETRYVNDENLSKNEPIITTEITYPDDVPF